MAFKLIEIHNRDNVEERRKNIAEYFQNDKDYKDFLEFLRLLSIGEITGKEVGERRQLKLIDMISIFLKNFSKTFSKTTLEDLRNFKERFMKDKIVKADHNPYSDETKEDCTETVLRFIEWKYPENAAKWKLRKWFSIRASKKTPEILTEKEVENIYLGCKNNAERYLIAVLFDGGFRATEFFNLRFEDFIAPTSDFPYYRIDLKEEYSKTKGRNVGMYWKYSTEAIKVYLNELTNTDRKKAVFDFKYDNVRGFLRRLGEKALRRNVHFHLFRKSSATYYASRLNRQQLCVRYGWAFSSDMPDVYIQRSGIEEEQVKEKMYDNDLNKIKKENEEIKTNLGLTKDQITSLAEENSHLKETLTEVMKEIEEVRKLKKNYFNYHKEGQSIK